MAGGMGFDFLRRLDRVSEVAYVRVLLDSDQRQQPERDDELWGFVREVRGDLTEEIGLAVRQVLGEGFTASNVSVRRGSVEILVTIAAGYYAVSRYKNFVESLQLLAVQLEHIVRAFLPPHLRHQGTVSSSWAVGPAVFATIARTSSTGGYQPSALLAYLLLSHAALLGVIIYMLLTANR